MSTRRTYVDTARALREVREACMPAWVLSKPVVCNLHARALAAMFKSHDPKFDVERFLKAAGVQS